MASPITTCFGSTHRSKDFGSFPGRTEEPRAREQLVQYGAVEGSSFGKEYFFLWLTTDLGLVPEKASGKKKKKKLG
jgi:hypothetical protein